MNVLRRFPVLIKNYLHIILAAFLLFLLVSPNELWIRQYGGVNVTFIVFATAALLMILVFTANFIDRKVNISEFLTSNIWMILFAAAILAAVLFSFDISISKLYIFYYMSGIFLAFAIISGGITYEKAIIVFEAAAIGIFITALYAVIQRIGGIDVNASYTNLSVNPDMPGRVESFFGNPNVYGFVLASLLPVIAGYIIVSKIKWRRVICIAFFIAGTAALIMTYSRGSWFAFAAGMFIMIAMYKPKMIPVMIVLGLAAIPFMPANIKERVMTIFNPNDTSISYRGLLMSCAARLWADHPVFGAGPGMEIAQILVHQNYWPTDLDPIYRFVHSHNLLLQLGCEMGIIGCITFIGMVIHNIIAAVRRFYKKSAELKAVTASLISGMTAMLLCGIADSPLTTFRTMLIFWILLGLAASAKKFNSDGFEKYEKCAGRFKKK